MLKNSLFLSEKASNAPALIRLSKDFLFKLVELTREIKFCMER